MAMGTEECTQECVRVHDMWGWRAQLTQSSLTGPLMNSDNGAQLSLS